MNDSEEYDLAGRLALARKSRGLSQQQVAARIGVTRRTVSDYETERRQPSLEMLKELAKCYQVSADYLLGIEKSNSFVLDLDGLTSKEKDIICNLVDDMQVKNAKLAELEK